MINIYYYKEKEKEFEDELGYVYKLLNTGIYDAFISIRKKKDERY